MSVATTAAPGLKSGPSMDLQSYLKNLQPKGAGPASSDAKSDPAAPGAPPSAPGASTASAAAPGAKPKGGGTLDKDSFMHLMVTQLKYQDPLNPSDNQQMAAQMAQFSSLEALQNMKTSMADLGKSMNESATKQTAATQTMATTSATALLGDTVRLRRKDLHFSGDESRVAVHASPGSELAVLDKDGETVRTLPLDGVDASGAAILGKSGDGVVAWDGLTDEGKPAAPGKYTLSVRDSGTSEDSGYAYVEAAISGVGSDSEGTTLETTEGTYHLTDLVEVGSGVSAKGGAAAGAPPPLSSGASAATAISLIGHPVRLRDPSGEMSKPGEGVDWTFSADPSAIGQVMDSSGRVLKTFPVSGQNADGTPMLSSDGTGAVHWDGESSDGTVQPKGKYFLRLTTPDGTAAAGTAFRKENIDGVGFDGSGNPLLMSGSKAWPYQSLYTVS
jgi:flagellar basal-body rod modification protein FlgD